jgi:hypothetical protein
MLLDTSIIHKQTMASTPSSKSYQNGVNAMHKKGGKCGCKHGKRGGKKGGKKK